MTPCSPVQILPTRHKTHFSPKTANHPSLLQRLQRACSERDSSGVGWTYSGTHETTGFFSLGTKQCVWPTHCALAKMPARERREESRGKGWRKRRKWMFTASIYTTHLTRHVMLLLNPQDNFFIFYPFPFLCHMFLCCPSSLSQLFEEIKGYSAQLKIFLQLIGGRNIQ